MRYAAFISYNHRDRKVAGWLHRALETYRFSRRLHGHLTPFGPLGLKLPPIFRDREELAAAADLAASVREALEQAASLIVICSPDGARSLWVNEEIRAFTALGRRDRIQCLIVAGEPNASRRPGGDPARECLPPALFEQGGSEPLAADIRPGQDGREAAKLKLLAGIAGLDYDELRRRELARRNRRLARFAIAAAAGFLAMAALALFALASRQEAIAQRDLARRKTLTAERTVDFVKSMFAVADPSEARGATITVREVLDRGAQRVGRELSGEPSVRADLSTTLGEVYTNLGLLHRGDALLRQGLQIPGVDPDVRARQYLALAEARAWQADDAGAAAAFEQALALARDPGSGRGDLVPRILVGLGEEQAFLDRAREGERNIRRALRADRRGGADRAIDTARDLEALGNLLFAQNRFAEARRAYEEALAVRLARQGELHPRTIQDLSQLGSVAYMQQDGRAAEVYWRRELPLAERVLGPDHSEIAPMLNNVALAMIDRRAYARALPLLRRAVAIQVAQRGPDTEELIFPLFNLALALRNTGHAEEAERLLDRDRPIAARAQHRLLAPILTEQADLACSRGNRRPAEALIAEARPLMARTYPKDPWRSAWVDLIDAQCHSDPAKARRAAAIVLQRWPATSHYGARAIAAR